MDRGKNNLLMPVYTLQQWSPQGRGFKVFHNTYLSM